MAAVGIATSAGGLTALREVLGQLASTYPAPIFLAHHRAPSAPDFYAQMLQSWTSLAVGWAAEGARPQGGRLYLAPPGRHLMVERGERLCICRQEKMRFVRPSADLLFESMAAVYGERSMGVILTGTGDDGSRGAAAIRAAEGFVLVQDETSSEYFDMPRAAIEQRRVDLVLSLDEIGYAMKVLVGEIRPFAA